MTSRSIYVEVDLDDFSDDEIREEFELRDLTMDGSKSVTSEDMQELFYAFHLGRTDRAMELARKIAQDATGRTLA